MVGFWAGFEFVSWTWFDCEFVICGFRWGLCWQLLFWVCGFACECSVWWVLVVVSGFGDAVGIRFAGGRFGVIDFGVGLLVGFDCWLLG